MLNVGPKPDGTIPVEAQSALRVSGEWIKRYPQVIYKAGASPWGRQLPWGDVTIFEGKLNLSIYDWPLDGEIFLPGLNNEVLSAHLWVDGKRQPVKTVKNGNWTKIKLPAQRPEKLISVVEISIDGALNVDKSLSVDPVYSTDISVAFAKAESCTLKEKAWMEKFGEWKHIMQVQDWTADGKVSWEVEVMEAGYYQVDLNYAGNGRIVWRIENEEGDILQNQQNSSPVYKFYEMGLLKFETVGKHKVSVSFIEGEMEAASLKEIRFTPLKYLE